MREIVTSLAVSLLSIVLLVFFLDLNRGSINIPYAYWGDALVYSSWIKSIVENGWWFENIRLGAPFGQVLHDFPYPATATLQLLVIKLIGFFITDHWVVHNIYYVLTFPLTALTSFIVLRVLRLSAASSISGSLIFTFLPYHFFRGMHHLFSSGYYIVPLAILLCLWVYDCPHFLLAWKRQLGDGDKSLIVFRWAGLLIAILVGLSDVHYSCFACFLLLTIGCTASLRWKNIAPLVNSMVFVVATAGVLVLNLAPSIMYCTIQGENPTVAKRNFGEADTYGLRMTQLLLPVDNHRIDFLAQMKQKYNATIKANENRFSTLGIVGSVGFLILIVWLICGRWLSSNDKSHILNLLSIINGSAFFLGTIGGLGALFAVIVTPQIRVYNRISIYIAFTSIAALCICIDTLLKNLSCHKKIQFAVFTALTAVALADQTTTAFIPDFDGIRKSFQNDQRFVEKMEERVSHGSIIFQLPYFPFPESVVRGMEPYEPLKLYLHSSHLRWTYGAVKDRTSDLWQRAQLERPKTEFLNNIMIAGFEGIVIDLRGYSEIERSTLEQSLENICGSPLETINDKLGHYIFYPLDKCRENLIAAHSSSKIDELRQSILNPVYCWWESGCYELEKSDTKTWRWCKDRAVLNIFNPMDVAQKVEMSFKAFTGSPNAKLQWNSDLFNFAWIVDKKGLISPTVVDIPPGLHRVVVTTNSQRVNAPNDSRELYFCLEGFRCLTLSPFHDS